MPTQALTPTPDATQTPTPTPAQAADATATVPPPAADAQGAAAPATPQHAGDQVNAALHALTGAGEASATATPNDSTGTGAQPNGHDQPAPPPVAALASAAAVRKGHGADEPASSTPASGTEAADPAIAATGDVALPGTPAVQGADAPGPKPAPAPVNLQRTVDAVTATIELAARQGTTQARIQLTPASLGALNIHLQKTSDGLIARVVADHSAAAQTLQQGADDLRRSLESSGVTVLRLDIETARQGAAQAGHDSSAGSGNRSASSSTSDPTSAAGDDATPVTTTIDLGPSTLVNVLA
jgi:flagellar hook-length control protein FliK